MFAPDHHESVVVGESLGHYEILEPLGAGGMGEVYRAHDTTLKRDVAIKVLPDQFAADEDRLARLEREAHLLASVNHPNVATIYSLEKSGVRRFLVMELVDGETLEQHLSGEPLPLEDALQICRQIARGLEAAHAKGIIHRDLKPSNVLISPDGSLKVVDFGIAKLQPGPSEEREDPAMADTSLTSTGAVVGTVPYMSPEQIRGQPCSKRTDIWAFGCVMFETLTGQKAFEGETPVDTLISVAERQPDYWFALPEGIPASIVHLIMRCLRKDPQNRLRDIGDAWLEIDEALADASLDGAPWARTTEIPAAAPGSAPDTRVWRRPVPAGAVAVLFLTAVLLGGIIGRVRAPQAGPAEPRRWSIDLPPSEQLGRGRSSGELVAVSPDGRMLVYGVGSGGRTRLRLQYLDRFDATEIEGSAGAYSPFFSPDSRWLGFFSEEGLEKVPVAGGEPQVICPSCSATGASWGPGGTIVFGYGGSLWTVSDGGGEPALLAEPGPADGGASFGRPAFLPDGDAVLFHARRAGNASRANIAVVSLDGSRPRVVVPEGTNPRYVETGHILFASAGMIFAQPFDLARRDVSGAPRPLLEGVLIRASGTADLSVSRDGVLAFVPGGQEVPNTERSLVWVDRNGAATALAARPRTFVDARVSPVDERVAVSVLDEGARDIWILEHDTLNRLTWDGDNRVPVWSRDGLSIAFASSRHGDSHDLYRRWADFSGPAERLLASVNRVYPVSWASAGRQLAYYEIDPETGRNIHVLPFSDGYEPSRPLDPWPFLVTRADERSPMISPDGRWVAYVSDQSGGDEVYVRPFPGTGAQRRISADGGTEPLWSNDGRELFYRCGDNGETMMSATLTTDPDVRVLDRTELFAANYLSNSSRTIYDVHPDGGAFLMIRKVGQQDRRRINVVLNWFEEVRRAVLPGRS